MMAIFRLSLPQKHDFSIADKTHAHRTKFLPHTDVGATNAERGAGGGKQHTLVGICFINDIIKEIFIFGFGDTPIRINIVNFI